MHYSKLSTLNKAKTRTREDKPRRGREPTRECTVDKRLQQSARIVYTDYGERSVRHPIGNGVMIIYDLTPAEWASGSVTMRFLVENYPKKVVPTFFEGSTMFGRYVGYISYGRYKIEKIKRG